MPRKKHMQIIVDNLIRNLKKRHMEGFYFSSKDELMSYLEGELESGDVIGSGGSVTLKELGVIDYINSRKDLEYLDRNKCNSREEVEDIMRRAFTGDKYFLSTNAITRDGILVNIDGNGNRLAALIYGPKKVYVICGTNKICDDVESAYMRVKNIASPPNCIRLDKKMPCVSTGKCENCLSPDCICNQIVVTRNSRDEERIKVLIVDGNWGF